MLKKTTVKKIILPFLLLLIPVICLAQSEVDSLPKAKVASSLLLNGEGKADNWVRSNKLSPMRKKFTDKKIADTSTTIEVVQVGQWFVVGIDVSEPGSIIAREGLNGEQLWYDDNIKLTFYGKNYLSVQLNPLGAVLVYQNEKKKQNLVREKKILSSVKIGHHKWRVELAIHKTLVKSDDSHVIKLKVERDRQHRGFEPFVSYGRIYTLETKMKHEKDYPVVVKQNSVVKSPYLAKAHLVKTLPTKHEDWMKLSAMKMSTGYGNVASDDFQSSEIRIAITEKQFGVYVLNNDIHMKQLSTKDTKFWSGDITEIFIGPVGYGYVQFITNPYSKLFINRGNSGGKRVRKLKGLKSIKCLSHIKKTFWSVTLTGDLAEILEKCHTPADYTPILNSWCFQAIRSRPAKKDLDQPYQESILHVTGSGTAHVPLRFAELMVQKTTAGKTATKPASPKLLSNVISGDAKLKIKPASSLMGYLNKNRSEHNANAVKSLDSIKTKNEWIRYSTIKRDQLIRSIFPNLNGALPKEKKIDYSIAYELEIANIKVSGIIFNSRNGVPVMGTLFEPLKVDKLMPVMIMVPAHHTTRNAYDLFTLGKNLADQGCVSIAIDLFGSGERGIAARWNHKNHQKNMIGGQMKLIGEEILGWSVSDILSTVDYLYTRKDIDRSKIGIIGGVAGGGDLSALGATLDPRITLSVPFNFHKKNLVSGWYDYARTYPLAIKNEITTVLVSALRAPKHFIQADEFAWLDRCEAAQQFLKKVYQLYKKENQVTFLHGGPNTHATHFNWMHRIPLYVILNKWWGLNLPEKREEEPDLRLRHFHTEVTMHDKGVEYIEKYYNLSKGELSKLNKIKMNIGDQSREKFKEPYMMFLDQAHQFQKKNHKLNIKNKFNLILSLEKILGGTKPIAFLPVKFKDQQWQGFSVESVWLKVNHQKAGDGQLGVPMWIMKPNSKTKKVGAVVCVAQEGKKRFLLERSNEIENCLNSGVAVILIDVVGTGETEVDSLRLPESKTVVASIFFNQMGKTLIGERVRNVRSVLAYLKTRSDVDTSKIALWGEGFSAPNGKAGSKNQFEETGFRQTGPHTLKYAEAMGMIVTLFTAILSDEVKVTSVLSRGGLISYESVLMSRYYYIPHDLIIPGILTKLDLPTVMEILKTNGCNIFLEDIRDGKNRVLSSEIMKSVYSKCYSGIYNSFHQESSVNQIINKIK